MRDNKIDEEGSLILADAIKMNNSLCKLNLQNNYIPVRGIYYIFDVFDTNSSLTSLDILDRDGRFEDLEYKFLFKQLDQKLQINHLAKMYKKGWEMNYEGSMSTISYLLIKKFRVIYYAMQISNILNKEHEQQHQHQQLLLLNSDVVNLMLDYIIYYLISSTGNRHLGTSSTTDEWSPRI
eukprot:TRINITY_DN2836_c0_g1_i4.p2 TRINITY_DN2836_c0_g1~~TRINITY_DN2836_c0_g1_i4.p2  ORF type:complete len:180 (-),score=32.76 TRINITY_DN2836_c0_g1_i4:132-671(-)